MANTLGPEVSATFVGLARDAVAAWLGDAARPPRPALADAALDAPGGAFVTWTRRADGSLRGCIGRLESTAPRWRTVADVAVLAAAEDPRFGPVSAREFSSLAADVSLMSALTPCPDPAEIEVGTHGLVLRYGGRSGVLLPQVPAEQGWDRETFLAQLCRKARVPSEAWSDAHATLLWFTSDHLVGE